MISSEMSNYISSGRCSGPRIELILVLASWHELILGLHMALLSSCLCLMTSLRLFKYNLIVYLNLATFSPAELNGLFVVFVTSASTSWAWFWSGLRTTEVPQPWRSWAPSSRKWFTTLLIILKDSMCKSKDVTSYFAFCEFKNVCIHTWYFWQMDAFAFLWDCWRA